VCAGGRFQYNGPMDIDIRPITRDQGDQFSAVMMAAFGETFSAEEMADHDTWFEYDRSIAAFDGDRMVGTGGAYSMDLTLPGLTTIPIGGLTAIAVLPTHRRRGILRSMIDYHFDEVEGRGELVSGLGASESVIYGRFG
jgi:predicted acetyltransferase